jgi:uncharacterized membrane protein YdjX (TVP38/TMEM64 family)
MRLRWLPLVVLAAGAGAFFLLGGHRWLAFEQLARHHAELQALVAARPLAGLAAFALIYVLVTAFSIPGGAPLTLIGGFLFGAVPTTAATVLGATVGASILYLAARSAIGGGLRRRAGPWLARLEEGFRRNAVNYLLTLRLIPLFPFFVVNLVAAVLGVGFRTFVLTTFFGIIPGTFVFASFGEGLGGILASGESFEPSAVLQPGIVVGLVGLGLLALAPVLYRRWRAGREG